MSGITVTFVQANGAERTLNNLQPGSTLMEAGRDNGVEGILADCGGCCDCGTCHVYMDEEWYARTGGANVLEEDTLNLMVPNLLVGASRLACQVTLSDELDGLKVRVATDA